MFSGKPVGEVEDDPRKKAGFGDAEEEAKKVEREGALAKSHEGGDDSPADHDAGDPEAGSGALEDEISRNLEEKVTEEEDARPCGEDGVGEPGYVVHG